MRHHAHRVGTATFVVGGVLLGLLTSVALFLDSSREVVLASHDAEVRPTLERHVVLRTGPLLPDVRMAYDGPVGVDIRLGKTEAKSVEALVERYAFIASDPSAQQAKVADAVRDMAVSAGLRGAGVGSVPLAVWLLVGPHRRGQLFRGLGTRKGLVGGALLTLLPVALWQPWERPERSVEEQQAWEPLQQFVGESVPLPAAAQALEIRTGPTSFSTRRLLLSAVDTYEKSKEFYDRAAEEAAGLEVREPSSAETVAILVSDRHDNIGMDRVARAIADAAGATVVLDAGDDTSTGQAWEAFSLDSLVEAYDGFDTFAVTGNHDHGDFVSSYLAERGWTMLEGEPVTGPDGGLLLGVDDPRSSGLGNWREETGLSFAEVEERLADAACASEDRIATVLVHDANLASEVLERGCADLVLGGHTHVQSGPTEVVGDNGEIGWSWTNGTTGGAAYAIAVGSKPRRDAEVSLVTYREGRPVGLQLVRLLTDGRWVVGAYTPLLER